LANNIALKIASTILGYALWVIVSQQQTVTVTHPATLCFYNIPQAYHINAPETVAIELQGKRKYLDRLDAKLLVIHIDCQELYPGEQPLIMSEKKMFLPEIIKLVHYSPTLITIVTHTRDTHASDRQVPIS